MIALGCYAKIVQYDSVRLKANVRIVVSHSDLFESETILTVSACIKGHLHLYHV